MTLEEILALEEERPCPGCPVCMPEWNSLRSRAGRFAERSAKHPVKQSLPLLGARNRRRSGQGMPERRVRAGGH